MGCSCFFVFGCGGGGCLRGDVPGNVILGKCLWAVFGEFFWEWVIFYGKMSAELSRCETGFRAELQVFTCSGYDLCHATEVNTQTAS